LSAGLDVLAVDDRLRLFNFARRDLRLTYLWILRALDQLRAEHRLQVYPEDVVTRLMQLAQIHPGVVVVASSEVRSMLDELWDERVLHRGEDASRAGSLAQYRNRNSVYQFTELGYRAFCAVEDVLGARVEDANLSRLAFSDILADLKDLAGANVAGDATEVYRKLTRLDAAVDDMARHAARFNLALGDIRHQAEVSAETFLRYKNALLSHMRGFADELDRYLPLLAEAVCTVESTGVEVMLGRAASCDERVLLGVDDRNRDWKRRWAGLRQWFTPDESGTPTGAHQLHTATQAGISGVIALLRQLSEARRSGISRATQLRFLAQWINDAPDDEAAHALASAAFNLSSVRHLGGAHADVDQISPRRSWWEAPGVEVSLRMFRTGKATANGATQPVRVNSPARKRLKAQQLQDRADSRAAGQALVNHGIHGRVLSETETAAVLRLLTLALEARTVVAGHLRAGSGNDDTMLLRLIPTATGSVVRTVHGTLHLPGFELHVEALNRSGRPAGAAR
jgi:uncharacterized protein (TIGR02677 family)